MRYGDASALLGEYNSLLKFGNERGSRTPHASLGALLPANVISFYLLLFLFPFSLTLGDSVLIACNTRQACLNYDRGFFVRLSVLTPQPIQVSGLLKRIRF